MLETELILERVGFPRFSARHCQQILTPLPTGDFRRTVNGDLVYTGLKGHHKYYSTIECQDQNIPCLEGLWRGSLLKVGCLQRLSQEVTGNQEIILNRDPVINSVYVMNHEQQTLEIDSVHGRTVLLKELNVTGQKKYIFYCPFLQMRLINYKFLTNEWGETNGWHLELEEV